MTQFLVCYFLNKKLVQLSCIDRQAADTVAAKLLSEGAGSVVVKPIHHKHPQQTTQQQ